MKQNNSFRSYNDNESIHTITKLAIEKSNEQRSIKKPEKNKISSKSPLTLHEYPFPYIIRSQRQKHGSVKTRKRSDNSISTPLKTSAKSQIHSAIEEIAHSAETGSIDRSTETGRGLK